MYKTEQISIPTYIVLVYRIMLLLYPQQYRKHFESEMLLLFREMYQEEKARHGNVGIRFWIAQISDTVQGIMEQQIVQMQKNRSKNIYSVIGFILILPFLFALALDFFVVLFTGSREAMQVVYHSIFWQVPILPIWLLGFPALAIVLNIIPLFTSLQKKKVNVLSSKFVKQHLATLTILGIACFAILVVFGHDFIPCIVTQVLSRGFGAMSRIVSLCRNA